MEPPIRSTLTFAQVALNLGLDKTWIYSVPAPLRDRIEVGQRVRVPFGKSNRSMVGYVTLLQDTCNIDQVKAIGEIVDAQSAIPGEL
ncbi:MAG: hypothetical protein QGD94_07735, partial [Planctomycetia bacterium]|nr:hypothetical protein [Planctomycetia bacterium]